jgi:hypothetical protein
MLTVTPVKCNANTVSNFRVHISNRTYLRCILRLARQIVARYTTHLKLNIDHTIRYALNQLCPQSNAMQLQFSIFKDRNLIGRISAAIGVS